MVRNKQQILPGRLSKWAPFDDRLAEAVSFCEVQGDTIATMLFTQLLTWGACRGVPVVHREAPRGRPKGGQWMHHRYPWILTGSRYALWLIYSPRR